MALLDDILGGGGPPAPDAGGAPPSIPLPGADGQPSDGAASQDDPVDLMNQVKDLLRRAEQADPDHEDKLLLEKMLTEAQQYLANQQKLTDTVTGAGPGAKIIRKASGGPGY